MKWAQKVWSDNWVRLCGIGPVKGLAKRNRRAEVRQVAQRLAGIGPVSTVLALRARYSRLVKIAEPRWNRPAQFPIAAEETQTSRGWPRLPSHGRDRPAQCVARDSMALEPLRPEGGRVRATTPVALLRCVAAESAGFRRLANRAQFGWDRPAQRVVRRGPCIGGWRDRAQFKSELARSVRCSQSCSDVEVGEGAQFGPGSARSVH